MTMTPIGDLAQQLMLRSRSTELTRSVATLTQELASNQVFDVSHHLRGDVSHLMDIERDLRRLDAFDTARVEVETPAKAMQSSLAVVQTTVESLTAELVQVSSGNASITGEVLANQALSDMETVLSALNTSVSGRSLFGGTATDRAPVGSANDLMGALKQATSGQTTVVGLRAAVDDWFADPNGFEATFYSGSDQNVSPVHVGPAEQVDLSLRADDAVFRSLLADMSLIVLAETSNPGLDAEARRTVRTDARNQLVSDVGNLTNLRASVGQAESRIEEVGTRNAAARTSLELSRGALIAADPFETAIKLEETRFQLESLYTVTARNARLSLLSYLE